MARVAVENVARERRISMDRTDVNPWEWSKAFGFSQAVEVRGAERILVCSGQTAIAGDGSPPSSSDMGDQVTEVLRESRCCPSGGRARRLRRRQGELLHDGRRRIGDRARTTRVGVLRRHSPGFDSSRRGSAGLSTAQNRDRSHGKARAEARERRVSRSSARRSKPWVHLRGWGGTGGHLLDSFRPAERLRTVGGFVGLPCAY